MHFFLSLIAPLFSTGPAVHDGAIVPQPELPICSRCNLTKPPGFASGDEASLSVLIDEAYRGDIVDMVLVTLDADGNEDTYTFSQDVIDDVSDSARWNIIAVTIESADRAALSFELADGSTVEEFIPVYAR